MFHIGDCIRVIPPSYLDLTKVWLNEPAAWKPADAAANDRVMLAGRYSVLSVVEDRQISYQVLQTPGKRGLTQVPESYAVPCTAVRPCPFQEGDLLFYRPEMNINTRAWHLKSLDYFDGTADLQHKYRVMAVINDYFLIVDRALQDPRAKPQPWEIFISATPS